MSIFGQDDASHGTPEMRRDFGRGFARRGALSPRYYTLYLLPRSQIDFTKNYDSAPGAYLDTLAVSSWQQTQNRSEHQHLILGVTRTSSPGTNRRLGSRRARIFDATRVLRLRFRAALSFFSLLNKQARLGRVIELQSRQRWRLREQYSVLI